MSNFVMANIWRLSITFARWNGGFPVEFPKGYDIR